MQTNSTESTTSAPSQFRVIPTASGHTMLLSTEEFPIYHLHMTRFLTEYKPQNQWECDLVQRITDNEWRINRIVRLEMGLYAKGQLEFADLYAEEDATVRSLLIETHTHTTYARQLNSLQLQEARLRRYVEKDLAELQTIQVKRMEREGEKASLAASASATQTHNSPEPAAINQNGFEFSNSAGTEPSRPQTGHSTYKSGKINGHANGQRRDLGL